MAKRKSTKTVESLRHQEASRKNIPTAEYQAVMADDDRNPISVAYERRNPDLDPQLVWRGKDEQSRSDLVVQAPPLFIQEKVHPKVLIDDLRQQTRETEDQADLFADFNGLPAGDAQTDFYQHDANWSNRMILGDSLQVMASLAEREGLRGKVQCIYIDPPYGIKFNSNFQWSTTSRTVTDGKTDHITREPEQVKAFRDTWRDGIHSYLTYLRDRLTVARDLLTESGSVFVQIGDENVHRVRALMDEVFGEGNLVSHISCAKTTGMSGDSLSSVTDHILWYGKAREHIKYRGLLELKRPGGEGATAYRQVYFQDGTMRPATKEEIADTSQIPFGGSLCATGDITSNRPPGQNDLQEFRFHGKVYSPGKRTFGSNEIGMTRAAFSDRVVATSRGQLAYRRFFNDFPAVPISNLWTDTVGQNQFGGSKTYVVQTALPTIERCILMTTDPGDLVLDPTCGSGTTAYVAEQWGRRWITIDTSRVALALARARVMGARYPYYLLADSRDGQVKEGEISRKAPSEAPTYNDIRQGFVYERVPHITLKSIANNAEIDVIWDRFQERLEPLREELNAALDQEWEEWEIPREAGDPWPEAATRAWGKVQAARTDGEKSSALRELNRALDREYALEDVPAQPRDPWAPEASDLHSLWWEERIARQKEIDASIAAKADYEYLYDKPYEDNRKVRVAGPFTVESLSPHRLLGVDENDELIDNIAEASLGYGEKQDFAGMILDNLKTSGVQQAHKEDRIAFSGIRPWPGDLVCAEGTYVEGNGDSAPRRRAGIFIGPEFGTVSRPDLVSAVREAADADFDVLVACAFNYDAHASEFSKLGRVPVLKARMNADLHMADDLKNTGKGNLFVIFGEPDIDLLEAEDGQIQVKVNGVDVFHPNTGEIRSDSADGIACWFVDSDYNEESFFVRHAYFLGANDPYKALRTTLKAEINQEAWETLHSDTSRPFAKPASGRIAVKVINHLGDEVMKVFRV